MTVRNTGFLVERLGQDCHPLQFLRELTQNAFEAIMRTPERRGQVVWDVDWNSHDLDDLGVYKLCIIDTGIGMSGEEMVRYINQLSSSGAEQSMSGNYGVGAKIAAATRNHAGVWYLSWKDGVGSTIHLWRDSQTNVYGLERFVRKDGAYNDYFHVDDALKPPVIGAHGTMIVLHGNAPEQDTMAAPDGAPSPSRWIARYLNSRYFRFPKGITVKAREGWQHPVTDTSRNLLRSLTGQEQYLEAHTEHRGHLQLDGAKAHWWILRDEPALSENSGFIESSGHTAALYQDELYETATARAGMARLQHFGVIFGYRQVVIYVEPTTSSERRVTTNISRTNLLVNNEPLPWAEWAAEFRANLPPTIAALVEAKSSASAATDHEKAIRERLKPIMDLFKISRYRPAESGTRGIDPEQSVPGGSPRTGADTHSGVGTGSSGTRGGTAGGIYSLFEKENGAPAESVEADPFPQVRWLTLREGSREPDDMEDRAARYDLEQNLLFINGDFRAFTDMVEKCHSDMGNPPGLKAKVEQAVRSWFEQTLVETVLGVQALRNAMHWTSANVDAALSQEALTAAAMPRYHVLRSVRQELATKYGRQCA